jgi:trimethylamine--corrinoid protein Co-methyltransferase
MTMHGFRRAIPPLTVLGEAQLEKIRCETLRVLGQTGVVFAHTRALDALAEAGCLVDRDTQRVRFPAALVEEALAGAPATRPFRARVHDNDIETGGADELFCVSSAGMDTVDLATGQPRRATRKEFYDYVRVLDALPTVHMLNACPYCGIDKVPAAMTMIESFAAKARLTGKAQSEGSQLGCHRFTVAMAQELGCDMSTPVNTLSPLTYDKDVLDLLFWCVEQDVVFDIAPGPLAGTSAPASLAGAMIVNNAETLAGIVLAQVLKPGHPVGAGTLLMAQNMKSGGPLFGSAATILASAALCQVWRSYAVDFGVCAPAWTDSKLVDYQAGSEVQSAAVVCALAGAGSLVLHGGLSQEMTAHPVKAVLDDDLAHYIERLLAGVDTTDEATAVDLIDRVGPAPGSYLGETHTRTWYRKESVTPAVWDLEPFAAWVGGEPVGAVDHAKARVEEILATHKAPALSDSEEAAVEGVLQEARDYYRSRGLISDKEWAEYQEDLASPDYPYA